MKMENEIKKKKKKKNKNIKKNKKRIKRKKYKKQRFINIEIFTNFPSYIIKIKLFFKIDKY